MGTRNRKVLIGGFTGAAVVLAIGLFCVYYVETDYKAISKMLTRLADAIEKDDLARVKTFIHPSATSTIAKAEANMALVRVPSVKFFNLRVESNSKTAQVKFTAVVSYKFKSASASLFPGLEGATGFERVQFDVEMEKVGKSWVVTDKCEFTPSASENAIITIAP